MSLINLHNNLARVTTESQAAVILSNYLLQFNIKSFAFTYYSRHIKTGSKLMYNCVSDALRPWHDYYLEQGYSDIDRTLENANLLTIPLYWDVHEQLQHAKNARERRMRLESIEFGIDKGISIPAHGPDGDFVSLTLHQRQWEANLASHESQQFEWLAATQIFYHFIRKIIRIKQLPNPSFQLTKREKECLALTAKGWRVEQIANELKISSRTVNFHIQNANKKMGTHNKYLACYTLFGAGL